MLSGAEYRVSWINAPDGRVLDSTTENELGVIRAVASRLPMVGLDELLVIEPNPAVPDKPWDYLPGGGIVTYQRDDDYTNEGVDRDAEADDAGGAGAGEG